MATTSTPPVAKMEKSASTISLETLNPSVVEMQFAVRGPIVIKASEIEQDIQKGHKKPFRNVLRTNVGDCHATGQRPITFMRQVLSLAIDPTQMDSDRFPEDVKEHVTEILKSCDGQSLGAYTPSNGLEAVRRHVAEYIKQRDGGYHSEKDDIFLTNGASDGVKAIVRLLMTGRPGKERAGILIPVPRYPLYTAVLSEFGGVPCGYYLDEDKNWGLSIDELERCVKEARERCIPRAIVIINPGNPTGQVLSLENIKEVIKFANREKLMILADEVYQQNVYVNEFHSFKKALRQLEESREIMPGLELASFMSASKGFMGECGLRGGTCEMVNFDKDVKGHLIKTLSVCLCSNTIGQTAMDVVINPPKPGEASYPKFCEERDAILGSLKEKAKMMVETFNSVPGLKCNVVEGAMYAFVKLDELPPKAIEEAKKRKQHPDEFYCFELLEETGICVVPGSGFGQKHGTHHFRTTILPPVEQIRESLTRFKEFHLRFLEKYQ